MPLTLESLKPLVADLSNNLKPFMADVSNRLGQFFTYASREITSFASRSGYPLPPQLASSPSLPILLAVLAGLLVPLLLLCLCGMGGGGRSKASKASSLQPAKVAAPVSSEPILTEPPTPRKNEYDELVCLLCKVFVPHDERPKHEAGKKHKKALVAKGDGKDAWQWMSPREVDEYLARFGKVRPLLRDNALNDSDEEEAAASNRNKKATKGKGKNSSAADDDDSDDETPSSGSKGSNNSSANGAVRLQGKGVAVVSGTNDYSSSRGGEGEEGNPDLGWTAVGSGAAGGGASGKRILNNMMYLEGGSNILEGFVAQAGFVNANAEKQLLAFVDEAVKEGQRGRLRPDTFVAGRKNFPPSLHYGCYYDWEDGSVENANRVEPIPPKVIDFCKKIGASAPANGGTTGAAIAPNSLSVYDLQRGQCLPPHVTAKGHLERPVHILSVGGSEDGEDLLLGLKVEAVASAPGEYSSGFVHRLLRRELVSLRGNAGSLAQHCLSAVSQRTVVFVFRRMDKHLHAEQIARGNAR